MNASVRDSGSCVEVRIEPFWVDVDRAHVLLDAVAITDVRAVSVVSNYRRGLLDTVELACREESWLITVLGYTEDDAADAMDGALASLREDIDAGRVEQGAHPGRPIPKDPLEPPVEALLRAYRERVLRGLGVS